MEATTIHALSSSVDLLSAQGVLHDAFAEELRRLAVQLERVSPWESWRGLEERLGLLRIRGEGPPTKVVRTLTYALVAMSECNGGWPSNLCLTRFAITGARSGCSDFTGHVELTGEGESGEVTVLAGEFVWDCSAWGMDQRRAAGERGYACMVRFPQSEFTTAA